MYGNLVRYGIATIGPIGTAGAQFLLSFLMLHLQDAQDFGRFSFLLITLQFCWGVWTALFCAPLAVVFHEAESRRDERLAAMTVGNLLGAVAAGGLFMIIGIIVGMAAAPSAIFGAYAGLSLLRWYARAEAYVLGAPMRTMVSDMLYALVLLAGCALLPFAGGHLFALVCATLALAALAGLAPFGRRYWHDQFLRPRWASLPAYRDIWRMHARWSLLGVATTEATANAHVYLVTILLGPAAFAPIAASSLMIRPMMVAMNALTEYERPRMAAHIGAGAEGEAWASLRLFRAILLLGWLLSLVAVALLFAWDPALVFPSHYDPLMLAVASGLWMLVAAIRAGRIPGSALLQAAGAFRPLAFASIWSAAISVVAVLALIAAAGPVASIAGVLLGEAIFAFAVGRTLRDRAAKRKSALCPS
ncbi:hypothetical protein BH10PSE13_BH10PSE13_13030 [soil metagenome]